MWYNNSTLRESTSVTAFTLPPSRGVPANYTGRAVLPEKRVGAGFKPLKIIIIMQGCQQSKYGRENPDF